MAWVMVGLCLLIGIVLGYPWRDGAEHQTTRYLLANLRLARIDES